jgi:hypothetical protein
MCGKSGKSAFVPIPVSPAITGTFVEATPSPEFPITWIDGYSQPGAYESNSGNILIVPNPGNHPTTGTGQMMVFDRQGNFLRGGDNGGQFRTYRKIHGTLTLNF